MEGTLNIKDSGIQPQKRVRGRIDRVGNGQWGLKGGSLLAQRWTLCCRRRRPVYMGVVKGDPGPYGDGCGYQGYGSFLYGWSVDPRNKVADDTVPTTEGEGTCTKK